MTVRETIIEALEKWAKSQPDKLAWQFHNDKLEIEDTYSFKELENATNALSSHLLDNCGLKTGDTVLLVFVPGLAFTASLIACFKAGLVGVPVYPPDPTRMGKELHHFTTIQQDCGAKFALTHATYAFAKTIGDVKGFFSFGKKECKWPSLNWIQVDSILASGKVTDSVPRHNPQSELAFLQYTSGSTSAPKGVMVSAQNLASNIHFMAHHCCFDNNTVTVSWLPQYHDMGLIGTYLKSVYIGGSGYYMSPIGFLKDPLSWIRLTARTRCTYTVGPNFAFGLVVRKLKEAKPSVRAEILALDLSAVKTLVNAAEPIDPKVLQEFMATFKPMGFDPTSINPGYGLAENTLNASSLGNGLLLVDKTALEAKEVVVVKQLELRQSFDLIDGTVALVSCGRTNQEGVSWAIVDPDTCERCPPNRIGELWLTGDSKALGYYNRPEVSQETFYARIKGKGEARVDYLRTGDSGFIFQNELYFCGRIKDIIIVNGLNYYPQDMERTAENCHDAIRPGCSAAFALKQESDLSECAVLVAELKPGVPESKYEEIVEKIISSVSMEQGLYLAGVALLKTKSIPKTTSGKISRASCKNAFLARQLKVVHQWDDLDEATKSGTSAPTKPKRTAGSSSSSSSSSSSVPPMSLSQVKSKISAMVCELGNLNEIATDAVLLDAGLTSTATTELSGRLSKEFGVKIRPTIVFTSPTIDDVSARVVELMEINRAGSSSSSAAMDVTDVEEEEEEEPFVRPEAFIAGWGIATPFPLSAETYLEIDRREREKLGQSEQIIQQMAQLVKASRIKTKHSCHPFFLPKGKKPSDYPDAVGTMKEDIFTDYKSNPPLTKRMQCYQDTAVKMCVSAAEKAVKNWGKDKSTITHILTTCTSGWTEPGIGCSVIKSLGLSEDIQKAELNFNGCFCGATCLRVARDIIRAGDANAVLIVACEVATTHYDWNRTETEIMIAQSLFADGAASIVVAKEGVWKFSQTGSSIVPNSGHLLGLRPPMHEDETMYMMTLSKFVSPSLYAYFSKGHGKDILKKLYNPREAKPALAIHPGGPRILEAVGDVFFELGWQEDALQASYDTFGQFGNLGSAAMLFVLASRLSKNDIKEDKLITMAFGPGVTVEYAQLERATEANSNAAMRAAALGTSIAYEKAQMKAVSKKTRSNNNANNSAGVSNTVLLFLMLQTIGVLLFGAYCLQQTGFFAEQK
eukprot:CAMPEP_0170395020 /NCGR_PEP_ID=MMETSP0117_2-20130122/21559_1 /TAXON_ID=400756 /ORGANISM="Durinskia baltica, Strain CSIRO CS-38" /LENGTH=1198 /DNA_ID=CAMNT_0010651309 /DNA_START=37 /DNA_END=3633 /DNA_ORIENTATION=+